MLTGPEGAALQVAILVLGVWLAAGWRCGGGLSSGASTDCWTISTVGTHHRGTDLNGCRICCIWWF